MDFAASRTYRPPVAGEPIRLREDGHWSTDGLVGYWPMREMRGGMTADVARDNHGTLVNGPTWAAGKRGRTALSFDDAADHVVSPDRMSYPATGWTLLFWYKKPFSTGNIFEYAYSHGQVGTDGVNINIYAECSANMLWRQAVGNETFSVHLGRRRDGLWHQYGLGSDGGRIYYYDDGVRGVALEAALATQAPNTDLYLGMRYDVNNTRWFWGEMANVMRYNRCLAQQEATDLHAAPDLPIWRPRAGVSMAALVVPTGRPRTWMQHPHGPRLVIGGS